MNSTRSKSEKQSILHPGEFFVVSRVQKFESSATLQSLNAKDKRLPAWAATCQI